MKLEYLKTIYPVPGIEDLIEAVKRVFTGKDENYQARLIDRILSNNLERIEASGVSIPYMVGLCRHHRNVSSTRLTQKDWSGYLMHDGFASKYNAIIQVLVQIQDEQNSKADFEKL